LSEEKYAIGRTCAEMIKEGEGLDSMPVSSRYVSLITEMVRIIGYP
jgi:hypothetical protein